MATSLAVQACSITTALQTTERPVTLAILFAAALSLPSSAQAIRVAPDTWPSTVDISKVELPTAGEKLYWWSSDCAPAKVTFESSQVSCGATRTAVTRV